MDVILEAAAQVFDREGLRATTNRVAERAGVSIGSLYQYFPDKQAVLHALAERHIRETDARLRVLFARLRAECPPFEQTTREVLELVVEAHRGRPGLHRLMHRLAPRSVTELDAIDEFEDRVAAEIAFHLRRCERGGDDTERLARTVVHAVDAHLHRVMVRDEMSVDTLRELVERLIAEP
ncbi:helix-turn-helix transcriptional regulator [Nocardia sp. NEAU-351]|uniref:Helix-turn-helix transcriptional regulator n=1 Tax=Nocardia bovistercoris TaxID=2785916 RepID=A0A931IAH6_9NOCA|nr:helix-turn-helix transcriptional regulator [Nocardia bovistercoris]